MCRAQDVHVVIRAILQYSEVCVIRRGGRKVAVEGTTGRGQKWRVEDGRAAGAGETAEAKQKGPIPGIRFSPRG